MTEGPDLETAAGTSAAGPKAEEIEGTARAKRAATKQRAIAVAFPTDQGNEPCCARPLVLDEDFHAGLRVAGDIPEPPRAGMPK